MVYSFFSKRLDQLQSLLDDSKVEVSSEIKENITKRIAKIKMDIKSLGKDFKTEKDNLLLYSKYNNQILNIRKQFSVNIYYFYT